MRASRSRLHLSAWLAVVVATMASNVALAGGAERTILADDYGQRLRGMFLGEILGQYAGGPVEGKFSSQGLLYTPNWSTILSTPVWNGDDDTCFEYLYASHLVENPCPTSGAAGQIWTDHIATDSFWIANRQARWLMTRGYGPPDTGGINRNVHWYAIDSQITTESIGAASPGLRQRAVELAMPFATITNDGYPTHAAEFYAAMYAAAPFEPNVEGLIAKGLEVVPTSSRTYQAIQDVRNWYRQDPDPAHWRATQALVYDKHYAHSQGRYYAWIESAVNTAMTTLALLYGGGNFDQTVYIACNAGFDGDCNTATAGGILGLMKGYAGILGDLPGGLPAPSDDYLASSWLVNIPRGSTITAIAAGYQSAAEAQILLSGGSITGEGSSRTYHIAAADTVNPPVEKPDPTGPKGLLGAVKAAGGAVGVTASVATHDPADDRKCLEGIIDGITDVTYNGRRGYSTYDGSNHQPVGGDFYQINFDRRLRFESVVFYEGEYGLGGHINAYPTEYPATGGYFTDLIVEVGSEGVFRPVGNLQFGEPLDPYKFYQVITLSFDPAGGDAIRIRGTAGGSDEYTTCVELEAYGRILGAPTPGDSDYDGDVGFTDYQILETSFGVTTGASWLDGDFDGDGDVDFTDYQLLESNFGWTIPEPGGLLLLTAGLAGMTSRRR